MSAFMLERSGERTPPKGGSGPMLFDGFRVCVCYFFNSDAPEDAGEGETEGKRIKCN